MNRFALAAAALCLSAAAQAQVTTSDRAFLAQDAQGGLYEAQIATVALDRSERADIKAYASRLLTDHATYNQALRELAAAKGVPVPTELTLENKNKATVLFNQTRSVSDSNFIEEAIRINNEDRQAAEIESAQTQDADIKAFLKKFAAMDEEHERMALLLKK